jgi:hypothetical protein
MPNSLECTASYWPNPYRKQTLITYRIHVMSSNVFLGGWLQDTEGGGMTRITSPSRRYLSFNEFWNNAACLLVLWPIGYFSVYYYTKCVWLKMKCVTLNLEMCNIKIIYFIFRSSSHRNVNNILITSVVWLTVAYLVLHATWWPMKNVPTYIWL